MFFASSDVKREVSKSVVTAMKFTTDDKHLIKWMWVKKITKKKLRR